jgi:hypothetical protein
VIDSCFFLSQEISLCIIQEITSHSGKSSTTMFRNVLP